jgi:hypothetical protein
MTGKSLFAGAGALIFGGLLAHFLILPLIFGAVDTSKVCSIDPVRGIVQSSLDDEIRNKSTAATLGARLGTGLHNWASGATDKLPTITYTIAVVSTTTVESNTRNASCTALIDVTEKTSGVVSGNERKQIHYTMTRDDKGTWIVSLNEKEIW